MKIRIIALSLMGLCSLPVLANKVVIRNDTPYEYDVSVITPTSNYLRTVKGYANATIEKGGNCLQKVLFTEKRPEGSKHWTKERPSGTGCGEWDILIKGDGKFSMQ